MWVGLRWNHQAEYKHQNLRIQRTYRLDHVEQPAVIENVFLDDQNMHIITVDETIHHLNLLLNTSLRCHRDS